MSANPGLVTLAGIIVAHLQIRLCPLSCASGILCFASAVCDRAVKTAAHQCVTYTVTLFPCLAHGSLFTCEAFPDIPQRDELR